MTSKRPSTPLARAALGFLCALLLFAQQLGLAHAVWHATQQLPQQGQAYQEAGSGKAPALPHAGKLCPLDAALGQVLGAGPVSGFAIEHAVVDAQAPSCAASIPASLHGLTPRSRGPPPLL